MSKSNVGASGIYEAGDQRIPPATDPSRQAHGGERYAEGKEHSHKQLDSKDERSLGNKLAAESKIERQQAQEEAGGARAAEVAESKKDSTLPARNHGHEPSKGAKVDQELQEEEQEALKKKGAWGSKQQ